VDKILCTPRGKVVLNSSFQRTRKKRRAGELFVMKPALSTEPVEKVQMANSDNSGSLKNRQFTDQRKPKNAQI